MFTNILFPHFGFKLYFIEHIFWAVITLHQVKNREKYLLLDILTPLKSLYTKTVHSCNCFNLRIIHLWQSFSVLHYDSMSKVNSPEVIRIFNLSSSIPKSTFRNNYKIQSCYIHKILQRQLHLWTHFKFYIRYYTCTQYSCLRGMDLIIFSKWQPIYIKRNVILGFLVF